VKDHQWERRQRPWRRLAILRGCTPTTSALSPPSDSGRRTWTTGGWSATCLSSSIAVYDLNRRRYAFLTGSFKFLLGYRREDALDQGPEFFYRQMHPDDLPVVLDSVTRTLRFLLAAPGGERKDYRLSFDFRIRRADGKLIRLLQQVVVLETDRRGNIWLILAVNDLVIDGSLETPACRALRHIESGRECLFVAQAAPGATAGAGQLSPREVEVLGLVAVGLPSRDIADRLSISVATVNNHRQHILEKTGAKNSAQAVHYAAALGIL
jgi:DNA-binding CsgD family transcriptional regulator